MMVDTARPYLVIALAGALLLAVPFTGTYAGDMPGKVSEASGAEVIVRLNEAWLPDKGDKVSFSRNHPALGSISVGEGVVVSIERAPLLMVNRTNGEGEITVGTDAIVFSKSTKRMEVKQEVIRHPDPVERGADKKLLKAAEDNNLKAAMNSISRGANVNAAAAGRGTALQVAALNGNLQIVQALLRSGADPDIESASVGQTALKLSARRAHTAVVDALLDGGANIDHRGGEYEDYYSGAPAITYAAAADQADMVTHLISRGANPNLENDLGMTPLFYAAAKGNIGAVNALLNTGVLLDEASSTSLTPLMAACSEDGEWNLVIYLLAAGANPNQQITEAGKQVNPDAPGMTALMLSVLLGDAETSFALILGGADASLRRSDGKTAHDLATDRLGTMDLDSRSYTELEMVQRALLHPDWGRKKAMEVLADELESVISDNNIVVVSAGLRLGVDPNTLVDGSPLFFEAIYNGNTAIVELFIEHGADPNVKDGKGRTAFYEAVYEENIAVIKLLIAQGADPNILPPDIDETPLHEAAEDGNTQEMALLLEAGMNPNILDDDQDTPLHKAADNGELEAFVLLLRAGADPGLKNEDGDLPLDYAPDEKRAQFHAAIRNAGRR